MITVCVGEADNIEPLIAEIESVLEGRMDYEIVYVDDGSTDDTPARLRAARRARPRLTIVRHRASCGQSAAIITGIKAARGVWIATLDGDGQNDPAGIVALWEAARRSGTGDRERTVYMGHRKKRKDSAGRRLASRVANGVRARLLRDRTPDSGCGLKLFTRASFLDLPRFDHMHRFLPALFLGQGMRVVSIEVDHRPRQRGVSKYGIFDRLWVGIVDLFGVMWLLRRTKLPDIEDIEE